MCCFESCRRVSSLLYDTNPNPLRSYCSIKCIKYTHAYYTCTQKNVFLKPPSSDRLLSIKLRNTSPVSWMPLLCLLCGLNIKLSSFFSQLEFYHKNNDDFSSEVRMNCFRLKPPASSMGNHGFVEHLPYLLHAEPHVSRKHAQLCSCTHMLLFKREKVFNYCTLVRLHRLPRESFKVLEV